MFDIWHYYGKKQIFHIFNQLRKQLIANNNSFFHYTQTQLTNYLNNKELNLSQRFYKFYYSWQSFQNKKRIVERFLKYNAIDYPELFKIKQRIIIDTFNINYQQILRQINVYKAKKVPIQHSYSILIKKTIKSILHNQLFYNKKINIIDINVQLNKIIVQQKLKDKIKKYQYKLTKFLLKYQKINPKKYSFCKANLVISKNWKDLLLQSTFKQWSSCINLITTNTDNLLMYSCTNGIKAGNLVAYCIFDLQDGKSIDEIMDDNGYRGLMYERSFWRCNIKRYVNKKNFNDYIFCSQHTSYGTIIQNIISYQNDLFNKINIFLKQLNNNLIHQKNQLITYKLPYKVYSDLHSYNAQTQKKYIYYFNINEKKLNQHKIKKLKKLIQFNEKLFTNDIIALLSVFGYFKNNISQQNKKQYILNYYLRNKHYILDNTFSLKDIINKFNKKFNVYTSQVQSIKK